MAPKTSFSCSMNDITPKGVIKYKRLPREGRFSVCRWIQGRGGPRGRRNYVGKGERRTLARCLSGCHEFVGGGVISPRLPITSSGPEVTRLSLKRLALQFRQRGRGFMPRAVMITMRVTRLRMHSDPFGIYHRLSAPSGIF